MGCKVYSQIGTDDTINSEMEHVKMAYAFVVYCSFLCVYHTPFNLWFLKTKGKDASPQKKWKKERAGVLHI